ncbi:SDR family oxidoreductase [Sphingobacterium sp. HJSM2_6]|uniref:SDR family oxidoreductase n=1 Tax=Sphingobacterium sp. HJSM2_6 TaxID=3366264 RepID=UPI003BECE519
MEIDLTGKRALVGGASGGIGKGIAMVLASAGAEVYLMARNEEKLKNTVQHLDSTKNQHHGYLVTDFLNSSLHQEKLSAFLAEINIDILVNNTQGPIAGTIETKQAQDYQTAFDLLFQQAVFASQLVLPSMKTKGYGRIINVSSLTVKEPQDALVLSNSMRTALVSWSKSLSKLVAADGITVNSILTGYFNTERLNSLLVSQAEREGLSFESVKERRILSIPAKRLGDPTDYGNLVAFLASPLASYLNGASIPLDGGLSNMVF